MKHFLYILYVFALLILNGNSLLGRNLAAHSALYTDSLLFNSLIEQARTFNRDIRTKEKCEEILMQALSLASADSNFVCLSRVYNSYGVLYRNVAEYSKSLSYHQKAAHFAQRANSNSNLATAYNSIGVVYRRQDNHPKATEFHLLGLKVAEQANDKSNIAISLNSLGNIFSLNGQHKEAFLYFKRALSLAVAMENFLGQAMNYNNIGEVFEFKAELDSALYYYTKSLEVNRKIGSKKGLAISYNAIGKIKLFKGLAHEAYPLFTQALEIDLALGDKKFIADSYLNLGRAANALGRWNEGEMHTLKGLDIAKEIGSISHAQLGYENLASIYTFRSKPARALQYYKLAAKYKDSLINEKNSRSIALLEVMFNTSKKEQEIQILRQEQLINQKELARQKARRNIYLVALLFTLLLLTSVLYALRLKRMANRKLFQQKLAIEESNFLLTQQQSEIMLQNKEIEKQRSNIEHKNRNLEDAYRVIEGYVGKITDSIRYAQTIQKALLPSLSSIGVYFSDTFILYKPKDFVSGDFYWFSVKNGTIFFALADCTGHGVPGAFMSIIGMELLNQAVNQNAMTQPAEILDFVNSELSRKLRKEGKEEAVLKDSMDIGIISMPIGTTMMSYSGASIPLTLVRKGAILEYKPQFTSMGISPKLFSKPFRQHELTLETNDWVYIYSDGYLDQLGGQSNKRFMRSRFLDCLLKHSELNGESQREYFEGILQNWKGANEQIDDILVVGLRI